MGVRVSTVVNGRWRENCHIASNDAGDALIVDPGSQSEDIAAQVDANGWHVLAILNTHAHYDHVGAVAPLQDRYAAPFYLHGADAPLLKRANLYRMLFESRDAVRIPTISYDIARCRRNSTSAHSVSRGSPHPATPTAASACSSRTCSFPATR